jgi:hypothetical protein
MPLAALVTVSQLALLTACHAQRSSVATAMLPLPPEGVKVFDAGRLCTKSLLVVETLRK